MQQLTDLFKHTQQRFPELIYRSASTEKGHGRLEHREIAVLDTSGTGLGFPGVQQAALLKRTREVIRSKTKPKEEQVFLITNLPHQDLDAEKFAALKRSYWDIENKLHYRLDFTFGEDRSTIRARNGPKNMSALRVFAVSLLMNLGIGNIKRCVDNLQHCQGSILKMAA